MRASPLTLFLCLPTRSCVTDRALTPLSQHVNLAKAGVAQSTSVIVGRHHRRRHHRRPTPSYHSATVVLVVFAITVVTHGGRSFLCNRQLQVFFANIVAVHDMWPLPALSRSCKPSCTALAIFLMRLDARTYSSKHTKSGINITQLCEQAPFLKTVILGLSRARKKRLNQTDLEQALDGLNAKTKGSVAKLCYRWETDIGTWRRETAAAVRVMLSHLASKQQAYQKTEPEATLPKTHPSEILELYELYSAIGNDVASAWRDQIEVKQTVCWILKWFCVHSPRSVISHSVSPST